MQRSASGLSPRARLLLPVFLVILVALSAQRLLCGAAPGPYYEFAGPTMGTTYSVKLAVAKLAPDEQRLIGKLITTQLDRVNALMSTYLSDSELSRFNRHASAEPFPIAQATLDVLTVARQVSELSGGAFDITVGPLVRAWGFGAGASRPAAPDPAILQELSAHVGYDQLHLSSGPPSVAKRDPRIQCDLSAIAKGFAVDEIARLLETRGYLDYLIEIGGELRGHGQPRDDRPWRVAVERPMAGSERSIQLVLPLLNQSLATSGDYRNYYEEAGARISHTIDPRTREPIRHPLASVSVLHPEAVWADALATALNVLGPEAGYNLAVERGLAAFFIVRTPPEAQRYEGMEDAKSEVHFRTRATPAFEALTRQP